MRLIRYYNFARNCFKLLRIVIDGAMYFVRTGTTPDAAYQALVGLFCLTRGRSNDALHWLIALKHPPSKLLPPHGVLGDLTGHRIEKVKATLQEQGYFIFPDLLSPALSNELIAFARNTPSIPCWSDKTLPPLALYNPSNPIAPKYEFDEPTLLAHLQIQELVADPTLLALAQAYLHCTPILDIVTMWWSTPYLKSPSSGAGQLFHFDMDRIKWLKFFFYLTDVTEETGPTCFVRGTHRRLQQPAKLLRHGYARLSDEEIYSHYKKEDIIELTCPRGTIVAMDTRGFHKGKPLELGERLVLQFEYCDSLFGAEYQRPEVHLPKGSPFLQTTEQYGRIFSKYYWIPTPRVAANR